MIMNISNQYRLTALTELAGVYPASLTVAEVARRRGIPRPFLARLLADQVRQGNLVSARGPRGGVCLARAPGEIELAALMPAESGPRYPSPAAAWLGQRLEEAQSGALRSLTLEHLVRIERQRGDGADYEI